MLRVSISEKLIQELAVISSSSNNKKISMDAHKRCYYLLDLQEKPGDRFGDFFMYKEKWDCSDRCIKIFLIHHYI